MKEKEIRLPQHIVLFLDVVSQGEDEEKIKQYYSEASQIKLVAGKKGIKMEGNTLVIGVNREFIEVVRTYLAIRKNIKTKEGSEVTLRKKYFDEFIDIFTTYIAYHHQGIRTGIELVSPLKRVFGAVVGLLKTRKSKEIEKEKNVKKKIAIGSKDGSPNFSFRVFTVEPGGYTPYHSHKQEHVNYIIEGKGAIVDEEGNEKPLEQGDFALVLPNEKHQYKNTGSENFVMICAVEKEYE